MVEHRQAQEKNPCYVASLANEGKEHTRFDDKHLADVGMHGHGMVPREHPHLPRSRRRWSYSGAAGPPRTYCMHETFFVLRKEPLQFCLALLSVGPGQSPWQLLR